MKKLLLIFTVILISNVETSIANVYKSDFAIKMGVQNDSLRLAELDSFWAELALTVQEGDFEGYKATYHEDAIIVFATGENKTTVPLNKALAFWKEGFKQTKEGKQIDHVEFRFSQRIGDESTALETGIFRFTSKGLDGKIIAEYTLHFEMLLVKREGKWYGIMEYQKAEATAEEWNSLK